MRRWLWVVVVASCAHASAPEPPPVANTAAPAEPAPAEPAPKTVAELNRALDALDARIAHAPPGEREKLQLERDQVVEQLIKAERRPKTPQARRCFDNPLARGCD